MFQLIVVKSISESLKFFTISGAFTPKELARRKKIPNKIIYRKKRPDSINAKKLGIRYPS